MVAAAAPLKVLPWTEHAVLRFEPVCEVNPFGPLESPRELLENSFLHLYEREGQAALVALTRHVNSGGVRVHVAALVALPHSKPLQLRQVMNSIEATALAYGADVLTMVTQHQALALGCGRWGGQISGAVISKFIKVQ